jgi:hypothetical protein
MEHVGRYLKISVQYLCTDIFNVEPLALDNIIPGNIVVPNGSTASVGE